MGYLHLRIFSLSKAQYLGCSATNGIGGMRYEAFGARCRAHAVVAALRFAARREHAPLACMYRSI